VKLDTDRGAATAARYEVRSIPTLIAFARGREVARHVGLASQEQLDGYLAKAREAP
jgi:thioredoxin-like negative regulator of GroEL